MILPYCLTWIPRSSRGMTVRVCRSDDRRKNVIIRRFLFFFVIIRLALYSLSPLVFVLTKTSRGLPLFLSKADTLTLVFASKTQQKGVIISRSLDLATARSDDGKKSKPLGAMTEKGNVGW